MTRIIADIKNKADAEAIYRVLKKFNSAVQMMDEEDWEDYVLGKMADDAEAEGGIVPREKIAQSFKKHGINF
jgi:hypothetical protein